MSDVAEIQTPDGVHSLITADEAARHCGVTAKTVRAWANRGYTDPTGKRVQLPVSGCDRSGRRLYRLLDVAKAEHATRARARRGP